MSPADAIPLIPAAACLASAIALLRYNRQLTRWTSRARFKARMRQLDRIMAQDAALTRAKAKADAEVRAHGQSAKPAKARTDRLHEILGAGR